MAKEDSAETAKCPFEMNVLTRMVQLGIGFDDLGKRMVPRRDTLSVAASVARNNPTRVLVETFAAALSADDRKMTAEDLLSNTKGDS
jgi:hypothetical protein